MTNQQRVFVEHYLKCWNASEAARRAGYKSKANVIGSELLAIPSIQTLIQERLREMALEANEVLARLGEHARNEVAQYIKVDSHGKPYIDVAVMIKDGKQHLIRGISYNRFGEAEVQIYDAQSALVHLGRHHKLFTDKVEVDDTGLSDDERAARILALLDRARARRAGQAAK